MTIVAALPFLIMQPSARLGKAYPAVLKNSGSSPPDSLSAHFHLPWRCLEACFFQLLFLLPVSRSGQAVLSEPDSAPPSDYHLHSETSNRSGSSSPRYYCRLAPTHPSSPLATPYRPRIVCSPVCLRPRGPPYHIFLTPTTTAVPSIDCCTHSHVSGTFPTIIRPRPYRLFPDLISIFGEKPVHL